MKALLAAVLAALATAAVLATVGLGADTTTTTTQSTPPPTQADALKAMQARRDAQLAKLAAALGVTTDKLTSSLATLEDQVLAQKVQDKELTQAQADAIKACQANPLTCDRSNLPAPRFGDWAHKSQQSGTPPSWQQLQQQFKAEQAKRKAEQAKLLSDLAGLLGVDESKLTAALKANPVPLGLAFGFGFGGPGMGGPHGFGPGGPGHDFFRGHGGLRRRGFYGGPPPATGSGAGATYAPPGNAAAGASFS
ncbi:MAG TPA: hypothetical protein VMT10_07430 [Solirubrobacteraceae bacterium]|nr:hypothetical protein [Solirubrobacteraceae bacterium]